MIDTLSPLDQATFYSFLRNNFEILLKTNLNIWTRIKVDSWNFDVSRVKRQRSSARIEGQDHPQGVDAGSVDGGDLKRRSERQQLASIVGRHVTNAAKHLLWIKKYLVKKNIKKLFHF